MLRADDVIDLVREAGAILMHQTVSHRRCARTITRRRVASSTLRATGQYLAGARFGHAEDMFQIHEVIQFRLLLR